MRAFKRTVLVARRSHGARDFPQGTSKPLTILQPIRGSADQLENRGLGMRVSRFKSHSVPFLTRSPRSSREDLACRPTDLLLFRFDGHAGDLLLDRFFDFGCQWSPRSHANAAQLPTPGARALR